MTVKATHPRDARFVTVEEIRATAIGNLPRDVADYLEAGAGTADIAAITSAAITPAVNSRPG